MHCVMPNWWQVIHPTQGMAIPHCCLRIWQILINFPESTVGITMHFVNVEEAELRMRKMKQWDDILQNLPRWEPFSLTGKAEKVKGQLLKPYASTCFHS